MMFDVDVQEVVAQFPLSSQQTDIQVIGTMTMLMTETATTKEEKSTTDDGHIRSL